MKLFQHGFRADYHDDAVFGDGIAGAVGFQVVADHGAFGEIYVAVNDRMRPPNLECSSQSCRATLRRHNFCKAWPYSRLEFLLDRHVVPSVAFG